MTNHVLKAEPGFIGLRRSLQPDLKLRCGKCGQTEFRVVVRPSDKVARVIGCCCARCNNPLVVNEAGYIEGMGEVTHLFNSDLKAN